MPEAESKWETFKQGKITMRSCPAKGPTSYESRYGDFISKNFKQTWKRWQYYDDSKCVWHFLEKIDNTGQFWKDYRKEIGKVALFSSPDMPKCSTAMAWLHEICITLGKACFRYMPDDFMQIVFLELTKMCMKSKECKNVEEHTCKQLVTKVEDVQMFHACFHIPMGTSPLYRSSQKSKKEDPVPLQPEGAGETCEPKPPLADAEAPAPDDDDLSEKEESPPKIIKTAARKAKAKPSAKGAKGGGSKPKGKAKPKASTGKVKTKGKDSKESKAAKKATASATAAAAAAAAAKQEQSTPKRAAKRKGNRTAQSIAASEPSAATVHTSLFIEGREKRWLDDLFTAVQLSEMGLTMNTRWMSAATHALVAQSAEFALLREIALPSSGDKVVRKWSLLRAALVQHTHTRRQQKYVQCFERVRHVRTFASEAGSGYRVFITAPQPYDLGRVPQAR